jgi:tetratricopeptide (TPR) repeat protein
MSADRTTDDADRTAAFIHRELLQLVALFVVAIATFFVTRALAANNRAMSLRDGKEWYQRGQRAAAAGRLDEAVDALRRAAVRDRTDKNYVLALARALALNHDDEAARGVLIALRDAAPEDAEVNLELARLAAERQDIPEALRFYHNALYAPWPADQAAARREIRFELIRFLLGHGQSSRAAAELLAVSADLPERAAEHQQVARLFSEAGDDDHALQQFQHALKLRPDAPEALAGAGRSAFRLGKYALARAYLRQAPVEVADVAGMRDIVTLVLARDPLANRIGSGERRRRLLADLTYARERATACAGQRPSSGGTAAASSIREAAEALDHQLKASTALEQDSVEAGVDLVYRLTRAAAEACGPPTALDQALILIGREHGGETR